MEGNKLFNAISGVVNKATTKVTAGVTATVLAIQSATGITFCANGDINGTINKTVNVIFNLLKFGGFALAAVGIVQLVKAIMEASQGQSQPGAVGKALGMLVGGIIMILARSMLQILGVDVENITLENE